MQCEGGVRRRPHIALICSGGLHQAGIGGVSGFARADQQAVANRLVTAYAADVARDYPFGKISASVKARLHRAVAQRAILLAFGRFPLFRWQLKRADSKNLNKFDSG